MIKQPKVFIVTINFNGAADTIEFIESLKRSSYTNFSLVIVDNSSDRNSTAQLWQYVQNHFGSTYHTTEVQLEADRMVKVDISFIEAANRGFAAANNVALRKVIETDAIAHEDYVLVVNNDVVMAEDALQNLVITYQQKLDENIGIAAPVIYYYNTNKVWLAGGHYSKYLGLFRKFKPGLENDNNEALNFLTGCAWLLRKDRLEKIGLLEESFFMYGEDLDYSLKVKEKGYRLYVEASSKIWHKIGGSSNGELSSFSAYWMMFGRIRNIRNHSKGISKFSAMAVVLVSRLIVFPYYFFINRFYLVKSQVKAIAKGISER